MKISLQRRHALTVAHGAFSHKIDYVAFFKEILNPEGHPNRIIGSTVTDILLNGGFCPLVELHRETKSVSQKHLRCGERHRL